MKTKNIYALPFKKKDLIKAISHPKAHFGHFKHAIDFILPEGTKLFAVKAGVVVDIKIDSKEGGADPKYNNIKYVNYITVQHSNGEFSQYVRLKYKGSLVKVGDKIKQGQSIAISGNTGFTTTPHLHFQIFKFDNSEIGWQSLEIRFKEKIVIDRLNRSIPKELNKVKKELERVKKSIRKK